MVGPGTGPGVLQSARTATTTRVDRGGQALGYKLVYNVPSAPVHHARVTGSLHTLS